MIYDLPSLARARQEEIQQQINLRQEFPRNVRRRRVALAALVRSAVCRLGSWLVLIGRRLECYGLPTVAERDYATG